MAASSEFSPINSQPGRNVMAIEGWNPFQDAISLREAMNSLLQDSFVRPGGSPPQAGHAPLPLDVCETENAFVVKASLPGVKPDHVQITVHGDTLTIRGESKVEEEKKGEHWHLRERRLGTFQRALTLATPVNSDKAQADFEDGVLTLTLPKAESARPRQIKIGGGSGQGARDKG
jgi:HSP20 family protein